MKSWRSRFGAVRQNGSELQNHVVDEYLAGRLSRRELLKAGSVLGLWTLGGSSLVMPGIARAADAASPANTTIRVGHPMPSGAIDPLTAFDVASPALLNQSGEYLVNADAESATLHPALALSWQPNEKGDVWTFKLRKGVRFQDGQPMTAKDEAAAITFLSVPVSTSWVCWPAMVPLLIKCRCLAVSKGE